MLKKQIGWTMVVAMLVAVAGCTQGEENGTPDANGMPAENGTATGAGAAANGLPADFVLASMPENVRDVGETKGDVQAGDTVAIRGRIGGSAEPFVDGRAAFTIVDRSLKACSDIPGDMCRQPWDYCCEPKDSLSRNMATVSVVDAAGTPLPMSLHGVNGLEELSDVVVVGEVAQAEGNVLLVNARGVYFVPGAD